MASPGAVTSGNILPQQSSPNLDVSLRILHLPPEAIERAEGILRPKLSDFFRLRVFASSVPAESRPP